MCEGEAAFNSVLSHEQVSDHPQVMCVCLHVADVHCSANVEKNCCLHCLTLTTTNSVILQHFLPVCRLLYWIARGYDIFIYCGNTAV